MNKFNRNVDDKTILDKFTENFCNIVENHAEYIICSGFVSIAHGRARGTEDVDMIVERLSKDKFVALHNDLKKEGFICIQSDNPKIIYEEYLNNGESVRYVYESIGFFPQEMEVKFAKDDLDKNQIKERVKFPLTGLNVYFSSIESNVAFKEELLKSEKDLEDARHLRRIYKETLKEGKINEIKENIKKYRLQK